MKTTALTSVVEYFRQLAESGESPPLDAVLEKLAKYFDAKAIGLARIDGGAATTSPADDSAELPWLRDAGLLEKVRGAFPAQLHAADSGHWLVSVVGDSDLVWARRTRATWSEEDKWVWLLASQAFVRWHTQSAPPPQHLEQAASVAGRLTHDFGNYLTGIMGFTELSLAHAPAESLLHRYLTEVLQAAQDGAAWVHRLHLFCRRTPTHCWPTVLSFVVAKEASRMRAVEPVVKWVNEVPAELPLIDMDVGAVQTVLTELVNNATEAGADPVTITFSARVQELTGADCGALVGSAQPGNHIEFTVVDDGPGISAEDRLKLFRELFYSTKPRHRGLGLLVVYGILHRFRGGLRIAPANGAGTAIQLYLPVASSYRSRPANGNHLLLVHPDLHVLETMKRVLESSGYRVSVAASAVAAIGLLAGSDPAVALVVTDLKLPHMSGLDLARRMLDHDPSVKFVFLHSQASYHGMAEDDLLKRFRVLRWPLEPQTFLDTIETALTPARKKS